MGNLNAGPRRVLARVHGRYESMRINLGHLVLQPGHILPLGKGEDDFRLVSLVHAFPVDISSPHPHLADNQVVHLFRFPGNDKHGPVGILALEHLHDFPVNENREPGIQRHRPILEYEQAQEDDRRIEHDDHIADLQIRVVRYHTGQHVRTRARALRMEDASDTHAQDRPAIKRGDKGVVFHERLGQEIGKRIREHGDQQESGDRPRPGRQPDLPHRQDHQRDVEAQRRDTHRETIRQEREYSFRHMVDHDRDTIYASGHDFIGCQKEHVTQRLQERAYHDQRVSPQVGWSQKSACFHVSKKYVLTTANLRKLL